MTISMNKEGFWTFRYAGNHGSGYGMFALETGIIVGADVMGGTWDGTYEIVDKHFHLDLAVTSPLAPQTLLRARHQRPSTLNG